MDFYIEVVIHTLAFGAAGITSTWMVCDTISPEEENPLYLALSVISYIWPGDKEKAGRRNIRGSNEI
jgi:hypothetical protein